MKTLKIILFAAFAFSLHAGYSQDRSPVNYSTEECISIFRNNYLFTYFRNPADTVATLDCFIATVDRIVPIDNDKKERIKEQILSEVRQPDTRNLSDQIDFLVGYFPTTATDQIPFMDINVNEIIRANFSVREYALIDKTIADERKNGRIALWSLYQRYKDLTGEEISGPVETWFELLVDTMFDYFDID